MYLGLVVGPLVGGTLIAAKIITNAQALLVASGIFVVDGVILVVFLASTSVWTFLSRLSAQCQLTRAV